MSAVQSTAQATKASDTMGILWAMRTGLGRCGGHDAGLTLLPSKIITAMYPQQGSTNGAL